jgi:hypothetical protein
VPRRAQAVAKRARERLGLEVGFGFLWQSHQLMSFSRCLAKSAKSLIVTTFAIAR